jgi:hypothetical protein
VFGSTTYNSNTGVVVTQCMYYKYYNSRNNTNSLLQKGSI